MTDVYLSDHHGTYQVWADGQIIDTMSVQPGHRLLTWREQWDIADAYRAHLDSTPADAGTAENARTRNGVLQYPYM